MSYFKNIGKQLSTSLESIDEKAFTALIQDCEDTLKRGRCVIATGLGKNVPICEKFEGTMRSLGLDCHFMHTNTATHGDLGIVREGDLVIILSKSGSTEESVLLYQYLLQRNCTIWLLSFNSEGVLCKHIQKQLIIQLDHEGDQWNIMPNNSSTLNLIVLQELAMQLAIRMNVSLADFKKNHPGGAIGVKLSNEK